MTEKAIALTKASFKIKGRGIVIELKHFQHGLERGAVLTSKQSGLSWEVKARILFDHAEGNQVIFENEPTKYMLLKFDSLDKRSKSLEDIRIKESNHVFQYFLKPLEHSKNPLQGEELIINSPQQRL